MDFTEIAGIYASKEKYVHELDKSTIYFKRLLIETVEWKIPHLMEVVPPSFSPDSVAEIGCFIGHVIGNISINGMRNFHRSGFDVNAEAIAVAKNFYPNVDFQYQDAFTSGQIFDLLILSDIVEHVENDVKFLRDCRKLSNNILLNLPLEKSISTSKRKYGFDDPSGHLRSYAFRDAMSLIRRAEYKIIAMQTLCIIDSFLYGKCSSLLSEAGMQRHGNPVKEFIGRLLRKSRLFNRIYCGRNLFAFLVAR